MGKVRVFCRESLAELKKVVWPGRDSVESSVKVVLVATVLFATFFGVVDYLFFRGLYLVF